MSLSKLSSFTKELLKQRSKQLAEDQNLYKPVLKNIYKVTDHKLASHSSIEEALRKQFEQPDLIKVIYGACKPVNRKDWFKTAWPLNKSYILQPEDTCDIETRVFGLVSHDKKTNTFHIRFRGTAMFSEFAISTGRLLPLTLNLGQQMAIENVLNDLGGDSKGGQIKASVAEFVGASIKSIDIGGKEKVVVKSVVDQLREIIDSIPEGANITISGHSLGTSLASVLGLIIGKSKKKFGKCDLVLFGPFAVLNADLAIYLNKVFPGEIHTVVNFGDPISRMTSIPNGILTAFGLDALFKGTLKENSQSHLYLLPGKMVAFHSPPSSFDPTQFHAIDEYVHACEHPDAMLVDGMSLDEQVNRVVIGLKPLNQERFLGKFYRAIVYTEEEVDEFFKSQYM